MDLDASEEGGEPQAPSVLLLGNGALSGIRRVLAGLGLTVREVPDCSDTGGLQWPAELLVTTAEAAVALPRPPELPRVPFRPAWIAVGDDFQRLRPRLRRLGVDYLIHPRLDRDVCRLLCLHVLYRGPDRRDAARVPVGCEISSEIDGRWMRATLAELGRNGCRLLSSDPVEVGARALIELPPALCGGSFVVVPGSVVRTAPYQLGDPVSIGIAFDATDPDVEARLRTLLAGGGSDGPVSRLIGPGGESQPDEEVPTDRRLHPRAAYTGRVTAITREATRVLLGRDLCVEGMRVEPRPELEPDRLLELAVYGSPREEPILLRARVVRSDAQGVALRFEAPDEGATRLLAQLVAAGPGVESLFDEGDGASPVVVTKALPSRPPA